MIRHDRKLRHLVLGSDGQIGRALLERLKSCGASVIGTTRRESKTADQCYFDLERPSGIAALSRMADVAYFCAGNTSISQCEKQSDATRKINVDAIRYIATDLLKNDVFIVFLSTDLVFDGFLLSPAEDDQLNPINEYARQKQKIEVFLAPHIHQAAIVRLGKVLFANHPLFRGWIHQLQNGTDITPFRDLRIAPIDIEFALQVLMQIGMGRRSGIWHASSRNDLSYSQAIFYLAAKLDLPLDLIHPVESKNVHIGKAKTHVSLNCEKLCTIGLAVPNAYEALDRYLPH